MDLFSISDLQQYSGIKAHTIRVWEQRYNALKPDRSQGNTRYYNGLQLKRLLNIVSLMNEQFKISELCAMPDEKLSKLLETHLSIKSTSDHTTEYLISQCIAAALTFDEPKFDKLFSNAVLRFGIEGTYLNVIYPLLTRLGVMWSTDTLPPSQEHFISNLIRQKLFAAIDALPPATHPEKTWLLFLTEGEMHDIGLLFANYLLRKAGQHVTYLGGNVPFNSIGQVVKALNPKNILFFMVRKNDEENDLNMIKKLKTSFQIQDIYMASDAARLNKLKNSKKFTRLFSVSDLKQIANLNV